MLRYFCSLFLFLVLQSWLSPFDATAQAILPNQLSNLVLWLRADSVVKDSNNKVSSWVNSVGANNFDQPDVNKQPTWFDSVWNGKPVIRFNGANTVLSAGNQYNLGTNSRTIFIVCVANNSPSCFYSKTLNGGADNRYAFYDAGGATIDYLDNGPWYTILAGVNPPGVDIWTNTINRSAQELRLYRNSLQSGPIVAGIQGPGYDFSSPFRFLLGAYNNLTDDGELLPLDGDIAEMIIYDRALPDNERNQVERYLGAKYAPQINLGPDIVRSAYSMCSIPLDAGSGLTNLTGFQWSTGQTTPGISVSTPGQYWVEATDTIFGYLSRDTINVSFFSIPDTLLCVGTNLQIGTGLTGPYSYLWMPGGTSASTLSVNQAGTYSVTVTDTAGCPQSASFNVSADTFAYAVNLGPDSINLCSGNSLSLQSGSELVIIYEWTPGGTSAPSITIINSGFYSLIVTDQFGCTAKDTAHVTIVGIAPTAGFTKNTACLGAATNFTDTSGFIPPSFIDSISWDFGGGHTDTGANPSFTFPSAGFHTVILTVTTNVGCSSSVTDSVMVWENPVASFDLPSDACIDNAFTFVNNSTAGTSDSITGYSWSLGDGFTSSQQNPTQTYLSGGVKPIVLTVTTEGLCTATFTDSLTVVATAPPADSFSLSLPPYGFIGVSGNVSFSWYSSVNASSYTLEIALDISFTTLVSDTTITSLNISMPLAAGNYYWRVIANNACGQPGTTSETRYISIMNLSSLGNLPLWLRADNLVMKDANDKVYSWINSVGGANFDQNNPNKQPRWVDNVWNSKPVIRFDGDSSVLSAGNSYNLGINSRTVFIVSVAHDSESCFYSKTLNAEADNRYSFYDLGTGTTIDYLDKDNSRFFLSDISNPPGVDIWANTINRNSAQLNLFRNSVQSCPTASGILGPGHSFNSPFRFLLGAYNTDTNTGELLNLNGDIAEMIIYDNALSDTSRNGVEQYLRFKYAPQINLGPDIEIKYGVCDTAITTAPYFTDYLWSTGETTNSIRIAESGTYWVTAKDIFGYTTTDTLVARLPYKGTSTGDSAIICLDDSVQIMQQISPLSAYTFLWQDNSILSSIFASGEGSYSATITDTNGCVLITKPVFVKVDTFKLHNLLPSDTSICSRNEIAVYPYEYPLDTFFWTTAGSNSSNLPLVAVDSSGIYTVIVTDRNGCITMDTINVRRTSYAPIINFISGNVCDGDSIAFLNNTAMEREDSIRMWHWDFGDDSTSPEKSPTHLYIATGGYSVNLILVTDSGCTGMKKDSVNVYPQPKAVIDYPMVICAGNTVLFTDTTPPPLPDSTTSFWLFNNADTFTTQHLTYTFNNQGSVPLLFIVTTNHGCKDTITKELWVNPPLTADFAFSDVCFGDSTLFMDSSSTSGFISTWRWILGDGSPFSALQNPKHKYQTADTFQVKLIVTNDIGCIDTVNKPLKIAAYPIAAFTDQNACEGYEYTPIDTSKWFNDTITEWYWNIDDSVYNIQSPQHFFGVAGTYPVTLQVTTQSGCADYIERVVTVYNNPTASFAFSPLYGEAPLDVEFNNLSTNSASWIWDFGDSTPFSNTKYPSHTYLQNGDYNITLTAISDKGCSDSLMQRFSVLPTELDLSVDNVDVEPTTQIDGSVLLTVTVHMTNLGTRLITSAKLYAILGTGGLITEDWTDTIAWTSAQTSDYTFHAQFVTMGADANSYVCVEARNVNGGEMETRYDNNKQCTSLSGSIQLVGPFPNPGSDHSVLGIILPKSGKVSVAIADAIGKYVMEETELSLPAGRSDFEIPAHRMSAAEYFIRVIYNDEKFVRKFVLKK